MNIGYYPGCSVHATAREYEESLKAVASVLDLGLDEIPDWSCCGASSAHATNHLLGVALPARNLALAEAEEMTRVLAPCAACYGRLSNARFELGRDQALAREVGVVLRRPFRNSVQVVNVVEILQELLPRISQRTVRPLAGLKVASYYGCLLVRPSKVTGFDDPEAPTSMEQVVDATGAVSLQWNKRTTCCGAGLSLSRLGSVVRLGHAILNDARASGARAVVVACPMCHSNLDFRQAAINRSRQHGAPGRAGELPILYITQLVGLALGIAPSKLGLQRHFVSTRPLLERLLEQQGMEVA